MRFLQRFLRPGITFVEIGPGDCTLSFEVSKQVARVFAIDVSSEIAKAASFPTNCELIISDGSSIDLPASSIDVAYSNQLMEHLHPDDARDQLENVHRVLKPGGIYISLTPNRLTGPHDVSKHFDEVATGFHLKEYTLHELLDLMKATGFARFSSLLFVPKTTIVIPLWLPMAVEKAVERLPKGLRKKVRCNRLVDFLLQIRVVAHK